MSVPSSPNSSQPPQPQDVLTGERPRRAARLWQGLRSPWLLLVIGLFGLLLVGAAWLLPQLPGQLNDEPATAGRWLAATAGDFGVWGSIFQTLGLYNVVHSPLLAALLALVTVVATVHLAHELGRLRRFTRLTEYLAYPAGVLGTPLPLAPGESAVRRRSALPSAPADVLAMLRNRLTPRYVIIQPGDAPLPAPDLTTNGAPLASGPEQRLLALHRPWSSYLTPLLPLGILLIVTAIWLAITFGWQVITPALAPGDVYRSVNQGLTVHYPAPVEGGMASVAEISLRGATRQVSSEDEVSRFRLGDATITLRRTVPALWVATSDGAALLAQPGVAEAESALGLVFPTPGSEESLLLPDEVAGLRLVRRTDLPDAFMVELYRSTDVQPSLRAEVSAPDTITVPLENGRGLRITPARALQADVHYLPGLWLAWLGMAASLAGAIGAALRPAYLLLQIAPWPDARTLVVAQASRPADLAALVTSLEDRAHAAIKSDAEPTIPAPTSRP